MHVVIIGGGVTGVTTAYALHQRGHEVTVVERRHHVAGEASHANGGVLHASHTEPWNSPKAVAQLLRWIGRQRSPLILRPSQLPNLMGWGLNFLRYSRRAHHTRNTRINTRLAVHSLAALRRLRDATGLSYADADTGVLKVFHDADELAAAMRASQLTEDLGVRYRALGASEVIGQEPALAGTEGQLAGGIYYPDDAMGDACLFTQRLAASLDGQGVNFRMGTRVRALTPDKTGVRAVHTDHGELKADAIVLASGAEAAHLVKPLGLRLPLRPVKGYSATVDVSAQPGVPHTPFIDEARKVVVSVLSERLRVAGKAEFAGFDYRIREGQARSVLDQGLANLPTLAAAVGDNPVTPWACLRPMTVDGPPILGATTIDRLYLNVGGGHLGWTLAAGAADVVAAVVSGQQPAIPLDGLTIARF